MRFLKSHVLKLQKLVSQTCLLEEKRNGLSTNTTNECSLFVVYLMPLNVYKKKKVEWTHIIFFLLWETLIFKVFRTIESLSEQGHISPTYLYLDLSRIFWCWSWRLKIANNLPDGAEGSVLHSTTVFLITSMTPAYSPHYHQAWIMAIF